MRTNEAGVKLIHSFESFRAHAYQDQRGVWTIGWGHTGKEVHAGQVITQEEGDRLFDLDIRVAESAVEHLVKVPLTSNRFSALVSFVYNEGRGNFMASSLLTRVNEGNFEAAANVFPLYDKVRIKGVLTPSLGLQRRRQAERTLFLKPDV